MPLISCPDCHQPVSDAASQCPTCGRPSHPAGPARGLNALVKSVVVWSVLIGLVILALRFLGQR